MGEYIGTYTVRREMHARPFAEVVHATQNAYAAYSCIDKILIRNPGYASFEGTQILALMMNRVGAGFVPGQPPITIDVIAQGDCDESTLHTAADIVGKVFEREVVITPMSEIVKSFK